MTPVVRRNYKLPNLLDFRILFAYDSSLPLPGDKERMDKPMALSAALLPEFDQEMTNTRKTLERVPDEKFSWKPHEKSGSMGWLAGHLANLVGWTVDTIKHDSFDMSPGGKPFTPPPVPKSRKELLELFDKNVAAARQALAAASDAELSKNWSFL